MKKILVFWVIIIMMVVAGRSTDAQEYMLGEGDVLLVQVYDHPDLTQKVRVGGDNSAVFSLLGPVEVAGMSVNKLSEKLTALYADGYIVNPQVTVFIEEFRSKKVTILGQISNPGLYELWDHSTFLELISKAGGFTKDAGNTAIIKRKGNGTELSENIITLDLKRLVEEGESALNIQIEAGDNIYITENKEMFYVSGEARRPGVYKLEEGTTVVKAIAIAGGLTEKAAPKNIKIIRKVDGAKTTLAKVKMDRLVQTGDVIVIPESFF